MFKVDDLVECCWRGRWRPGRVLSVGPVLAKVEFFTPYSARRTRVAFFTLDNRRSLRLPIQHVRAAAEPRSDQQIRCRS